MGVFNSFIENRKDEELRRQAMLIADKFIEFIGSSKNIYGDGIGYDHKLGIHLGELVPEYSALRLKFINQPGFGKNKDALGHLTGKRTISLALPTRTRPHAMSFGVYKNTGIVHDRVRIGSAVARFLSKPDNYDTFVHEVTHFLDRWRLGDKVFKNYPDGEYNTKRYYNHPSEYNAFLQAFLMRMHRSSPRPDWKTVRELLGKEYWFVELDPRLQRRAIQRAYEWYLGPSSPAE